MTRYVKNNEFYAIKGNIYKYSKDYTDNLDFKIYFNEVKHIIRG